MSTTSFATLEQAQNYKSLDSYKAGWIIECKWKVINDCCLNTGKVYAISTTPLQPWVIVQKFWSYGLWSWLALVKCALPPPPTMFWCSAVLDEKRSCISGPTNG